jgi:hypothetical protein
MALVIRRNGSLSAIALSALIAVLPAFASHAQVPSQCVYDPTSKKCAVPGGGLCTVGAVN